MQPVRWQLQIAAQEKIPNPYLLCRLVGRRARMLINSGVPKITSEAIDQALEEVRYGVVAPPPD